MNDEMTHQSLNEYGFTAYEFPAEVSDAAELQQIDLDFCKYAQATGTNYIEMCKRVAMIHAKLARAGRYGGGQWLAWIEARGLSERSARRMQAIGEHFNAGNLPVLKNLEDMPRGLLYAASKQNASPVAWELLSSNDPVEVEKGKKLLDAENQIIAARKDFEAGAKQAYKAAQEWVEISHRSPQICNDPQYRDVRELAECMDEKEAIDVLFDQVERKILESTPEELATWLNQHM